MRMVVIFVIFVFSCLVFVFFHLLFLFVALFILFLRLFDITCALPGCLCSIVVRDQVFIDLGSKGLSQGKQTQACRTNLPSAPLL